MQIFPQLLNGENTDEKLGENQKSNKLQTEFLYNTWQYWVRVRINPSSRRPPKKGISKGTGQLLFLPTNTSDRPNAELVSNLPHREREKTNLFVGR